MFVIDLEGKMMLVPQTKSWTDFVEQVGGDEFGNQDKGLYYTIASVIDQETLMDDDTGYKKFAERMRLGEGAPAKLRQLNWEEEQKSPSP